MTLKTIKRNGYNVYIKNGDVDYLAILDAFLADKCKSTSLGSGNIDRTVSLVEYDNFRYIIKRDCEVDRRIEKKLISLVFGPFYSKLIKKIAGKEKDRDYPWQDLYLVMEKSDFRQVKDVYAIFEYVEGIPLSDIQDREKYIPELAKVVSVLHDNGLASNDIHWGNFILQEDNKLKIIDLSCKGSISVCQANDILALKNKFSYQLPPTGFMFYVIQLKEKLRKLSRRIRKRS